MPEISDQEIAQLRKQVRNLQAELARQSVTFRQIRNILQTAASNRQFMQIANPARRVLNLLPTP